MVRALLVRGMLAGLLAGVLAFGFARVFGEPQLAVALGAEAHEHHHMPGGMPGAVPEPELVNRRVQSTIGLATGIVVYAAALGGVFALVFAYAYRRIGNFGPRATAALLALIGFVTLILVPQLKYPANPPPIGDPSTIGSRTAVYFTMLALSVIAAVAAVSTARSLVRRVGAWNGGTIGAVAYLFVIAAAMTVLPSVDEVPADFSATLLWQFRLASLGIEAVLWTALGLLFGGFAERLFAAQPHPGLRPERILR